MSFWQQKILRVTNLLTGTGISNPVTDGMEMYGIDILNMDISRV